MQRFDRENVTGARKKHLDVVFNIWRLRLCKGSEGRQ